jgi:CBS domain-containing protein
LPRPGTVPNFGTGKRGLKRKLGDFDPRKRSPNPARVSLNKRNNLQIHAAVNLQKRRIEYMYMNNTDENIDSPGHRLVDRPMTVADVMTRHMITLNPYHSFADSVSLMAKHSFRHFLVADAAGRLVGVVSDTDILRVLARTTNWNATSVIQFMTHDVITVEPETEISVAVGKMLSKRVNCLPVVDDENNLCGIVTSTDFLKTFRWVQETSEKEAKCFNDAPVKA